MTAALPQAVPVYDDDAVASVVAHVREPIHVVSRPDEHRLGLAIGSVPHGVQLHASLPPLYPEWLGDATFCRDHLVRFPYVAGEMANGIATTDMVVAMATADMLGFFGAGGLGSDRVDVEVRHLARVLHGRENWGVNLIHSPTEPRMEGKVVDILRRHRVPRVCASAFMDLTPAVVKLAASGLVSTIDGRITRATRLFAKISRPEVAERFLSPAPQAILDQLVAAGELSADEARIAARIPVAEDVTVEADSGGHTDNRPLVSLLPTIISLRDQIARKYGYRTPIRVGAAGGLGTPEGVAAAFGAGAAYVVTGSVNQVAVESGLSEDAKGLLADADIADVMMAPAADMFELGVTVQVLRRGTMFGPRAAQLYELYRKYDSLEDIPADELAKLETRVLRASIAEVWSQTRQFWTQRDPAEAERADRDPKHRMALVFRWYLGMASKWAITGESSRRTDYQIWCGPALGAFNRWTAGTFLAEPASRTVAQIAHNLIEGAAVVTRAHQLRTCGFPVPASAFSVQPRRLI